MIESLYSSKFYITFLLPSYTTVVLKFGHVKINCYDNIISTDPYPDLLFEKQNEPANIAILSIQNNYNMVKFKW